MLRQDSNDPRETCPFCQRWISLEHRRCLCGAWIRPPFAQSYLAFGFALLLVVVSSRLDPLLPRLFPSAPPPIYVAGLFGLIVAGTRLSMLHDHYARRRRLGTWLHLFFVFVIFAAVLALLALLFDAFF
jgi:uncharacterized membrane protein YvlD (DUF360 family)